MEFKQVQYLSPVPKYPEKEALYLEVRRREDRVLKDEVVKSLPLVSKSSLYAKEWNWRKRSFQRFMASLPKGSPLRILDLGCGNGWMANRLAENPRWAVFAVDLNQEELEQGARLFGRSNLKFYYADILEDKFPEQPFDIILLAASVQYFPDLQRLIVCLRKQLAPNGQIHLLDSPCYGSREEQMAAKQRTVNYYQTIGAPEMAAFYHHHLWADVKALGGIDLNNTLWTKVLQKFGWLSPFPWLKF